jgi:hypothetical protein
MNWLVERWFEQLRLWWFHQHPVAEHGSGLTTDRLTAVSAQNGGERPNGRPVLSTWGRLGPTGTKLVPHKRSIPNQNPRSAKHALREGRKVTQLARRPSRSTASITAARTTKP